VVAILAPGDPNKPETVRAADVFDALVDDMRATGSGGAGRRVQNADQLASRAQLDAQDAQANQDWWQQQFDSRGLDPTTMKEGEWDALYRDLSGLPASSITMDDMTRAAGPQPFTLGPLQMTVDSLRQRFYGNDMPAEVKGLVGDVMKAEKLSVSDVEQLSRRARTMAGRAPDRTQAAYTNAIGDAIDGFLRSAAPADRVEALRTAQRNYRDFAQTFLSREAGKVNARKFGEPVMDASQVGRTMIPAGRGGAEVAQRTISAVGGQKAEEAARAEVRRALDAAGTDPQAVAKVQASYNDALRQFPTVAEDIGKAREIAALADAFGKSPLGKIRTAADPVVEVSKLLGKQDRGVALRQLIGQVKGNADASAGLRRAIGEHIATISASRSGVNDALAPETVNNALRQSIKSVLDRTAMTDLLSREQRRVLLNIHRETKAAQFAATANRAPGSDTARNAAMWGQFATIVARGIPKGAGAKSLLDLAVSVMGRAEAVRDLTTQALLDPALAADLLRTATPDRARNLSERMLAYVKGAGIGAAAGSGEPTYSAERM
jgi:hypothetical protein